MIAIEALYELYRRNPVISTDSRRVLPNSIFFALKGDRFDGNHFAAEALRAGAVAAVIDDPKLREKSSCYYVPNVLTALHRLATRHRDSLNIPVIAITGSNGKTTTKELISAVLGKKFNVHANPGNLNNHIGVPLTLLSIKPGVDMALAEMGANQRGDIAVLCHLAKPTHGLITNIGKAHLAGFSDLNGVREVKSELFYFLKKNKGTIFLNGNEESLHYFLNMFPDGVVYNSGRLFKEQEIYVECISESPNIILSLRYHDQDYVMESSLFGKYNFQNILSAIAIGVYFDVAPNEIVNAIENFRSLSNRSQKIVKGSNIFFLDAYNANPTSVEMALDFFESVQLPNKAVILGDMLELGSNAETEHRSILERLVKSKPSFIIILVGPLFEKIAEDYKSLKGLYYFPDVKSLKNWFKNQHFENHCFLIKGSRSIGLEQLLA